MIKKYLKEKHHISNYEIAQIEFLFQSIFSELSKMIIMGILFREHLGLYLFALCIMLYLRSTTGGLHFYTYWSCLATTFAYLWLAIIALPGLRLPSHVQTAALLTSIIICYLAGPVVSKYRPAPSPRHYKHCRNLSCGGIFLYGVISYIMPANQLTTVGFWVIILHSFQLMAAKSRKKGGEQND